MEMGYYDEDFYCEPSEFEQQVDEFKQSLLNAVRDDYKAEMEQLRKENDELKPIKNRMREIEREREREKQELVQAKAEALKCAKEMRFAELLEDYQSVIYAIDFEHIYAPKCNKCDDDRMVEYVTPLGRNAKENCICKKYITKHQIREVAAAIIKHDSPKYGISVEYYDVEYEDSVRAYQMFKPGSDYESVDRWTYFADREEAQKCCDWLNAKEAEKA